MDQVDSRAKLRGELGPETEISDRNLRNLSHGESMVRPPGLSNRGPVDGIGLYCWQQPAVGHSTEHHASITSPWCFLKPETTMKTHAVPFVAPSAKGSYWPSTRL